MWPGFLRKVQVVNGAQGKNIMVFNDVQWSVLTEVAVLH